MYSLGILLFMMFYGFSPIAHANEARIHPENLPMYQALVSGNPMRMLTYLLKYPLTSKVAISPNMISILSGLLNKNPKLRPSCEHLLSQNPWVTDADLQMTDSEYYSSMDRIYKN